MRRTVAPTIIDKPDDIPAGVNLDDPVYRTNLAEAFRRQTDSEIEKLSRIYDEFLPDPSPPDSSHSSHGVAAVRKNKSCRKRIFVDAHWALLEAKTYRLLDQHGGLTEDDPKFNSIAKLIKQLQDYAQAHSKFKEVGGAPEKETMRERVNRWIEEWKARRAAGN